MKIVLITIVGSLVLAVGYLALVPETATRYLSIAASEYEDNALVSDTQCTSTACMNTNADMKRKNQDGVQSNIPDSAAVPYVEFVNPSGFINSEPFRMADYIGKKIIIIEFITYSCINCKRTFPYMQKWHELYADEGLLVVGIHTPEFAYERDRTNVIAAMEKEGITFPIVMDNEYVTWNAYKNRFWPHRYIIDYEGNVVFDHIGEGAYSETEEVIKKLLADKPSETRLESNRQ